jgi:DNA-binding NtrC family response regulator/tetratricopeptide (TPR) repeat protein
MARANQSSPIHPTERLVGHSSAMNALRLQLRHLATFDTLGNPHAPTVLFHGETGTGKGLIARILHASGPRAAGPFLEVNCAAIPETLLEAELFGFEAGAFTDAKRAKPGLWKVASGGTLFLDEVAELPLPLQSKLLKVIEDKRVRRLGAVTERPVDVKLVAASQAELSALVKAGRFRADLYHRLSVVLLTVPPLRERREDILVLARHFFAQYAAAHGLSPQRLSAAAEAWLQGYDWPGNVRELSHLMERIMLFSREAIVAPDTLEELCLPRLASVDQRESGPGRDAPEAGEEGARIAEALRHTGGNVVQAARLLGLSRAAIRYRMARYGIISPRGVPHLRSPAAGNQGASMPAEGIYLAPQPASPASVSNWEQKPVAVLAIELTWPTAMDNEAPRYEPWTMASEWEQTILEKVRGFGGVILKCSPSLLLAGFGIPHTLEQLPQRAVQAALALRRLMAEAAKGGPYPELRMAVHWGQVLVDTGATDPMARLSPLGETLALPVRLLGQAASEEILVSPEVGFLVEGWCELQAREGTLGRGPLYGVGAYTVTGLKSQWSPLRMYRGRPLSRFIGRTRELAVLEDLLAQTERGRGQVVGIVGEPGVGKSRLCYEFTHAPIANSWLILETSASSYSQAVPYLPVIDLLKAYFQIQDRDAVPLVREKVARKIRALDEALESCLPAFLALLDVPVEDSAWQAFDPLQRRQHTLDALKRLLLRNSQVRPLLLVVENLHWSDSETQAFLDSLIKSLPTARLLLLINYRPEYQHGWGGKTYYTQLRLDPLPPASTEAFLQPLLGNDLSLAPLTRLLIARTEGNPFFLEESARTLVETGVLVGEPGAYRLAKPLDSLQVPATVQAVVAARIDRLPPGDKRLLQTAAVIGTEVPLPLLQAIAELPEDALHRGLAHLQAAEFLYETRLFPEVEYTFKHALTHEVAYGSLLRERRRVLHARLVEALEALAGDRLTEQVERLAHHALRGEVWDKAVTYCQQAGARAHDRAAFRETVASFEQALQALAHLPEHGDTGVLAIEIHLALEGALTQLGEHGRWLALLGEAEALARMLDDRARLGRVLAQMANVLRMTGDYDSAMAAGRQALDLAAELGESALQVRASHRLGQAYCDIGDFGRAAELLRRNVEAADGESGTPSTDSLFRIESRAYLARTLSALGAFAEGRRHGEEALRLATLAGRGPAPIAAHVCLGLLYLAQGDLEHAIRVLEQGLALCRASGSRGGWLRPMVAGLGYAYALQGRLAEGRALLEEAISVTIRTGSLGGQAYQAACLSEVCRLTGRGEEAWQHARQALDLARQLKERGSEALALYQLGVVQAHANPPDVAPAEVHYQQALALAKELGMRPLVAHGHLGLGTLYSKIGRLEQARAELSAAIELYRAMEMTFWLPQAEAALAQVDGSR